MTATNKPPKVPKTRGRPKKSAIKLGVKQTARITAKRAIKDNIKTSNQLLTLVLVAGWSIGPKDFRACFGSTTVLSEGAV